MGAVTAAVIGGGAMIGSTLLAGEQAKKGRDAQARANQAATAALASVGIPEIEAQEILLENPSLVGEFIPEAERSLELEKSLLQNIASDPALAKQQMESLEGLGELAEGGLTEADKAAAREIQRDVAQSDAARRKSILQNMAQRGVLGSGMELAAQLDAAQSAAEQQSAAADRLTQQVQSRAMQALTQSGNLAGNIRSQDFGEQARIAQAQDAINRWNVANQQDIASRNIRAQNEARAANLNTRQQRENTRAALANEQQRYNKQLIQQDYSNRLARAGGQAQGMLRGGDIAAGRAQDQARMIGGIGSAIGNIAGAAGGYFAQRDAADLAHQRQLDLQDRSAIMAPSPSYQLPASNRDPFDPIA